MYTIYHNVAVRAIAAAAPANILDNEAYADTINEKRYRRKILYTGIKRRHAAIGHQRASDLASIAAEKLLKKLDWDPSTVKVLVFITQTPDLNRPSTAVLIQNKLHLSQDVLAFDINLGCSGFTSGIQIVAGMLSQIKGRGLLLMGDCHHHLPGTEFNGDYILFGDGGAAAAMEYDEAAETIPSAQLTDGSRFRTLCSTYQWGDIMDGNAIVLFSLSEVVDSINEFYEHYGIYKEDVDFYALHQAQKIIVDGISQNCSLKPEKVLSAYQEYGNTSSASVPFAICANTDKFQKNRLKIFACGFGIGLAWSSVLLSLDRDCILPLIESDYAYPTLLG